MPINIAIDGYSSTGKSTMARELARELNYRYIDTGAMYRGVTLWALQEGYFDKKLNVEGLLSSLSQLKLDFKYDRDQGKSVLFLNDKMVENEIRSSKVADRVSEVATISEVRKFLVEQQQAMAQEGAVVMDGRDIASVVLPDAELKIFMTADPEIRALRRYNELKSKGMLDSLESVKENLQKRDAMDTSRADSPLIQVEDAKVLDNTEISPQEQLKLALSWVREFDGH